MSTRFENLVTALLNGETVDFEPRTRMEQYLKNCCDQCGCEGLPTPRARAEILLYQLADQLEGGNASGEVTEKSTATEMNALLETAEVGTVFKYVGETTDDYENGALYIVEEV